MKQIFTYIKYELKIFLGDLGNMFWMIVFPLLLMTIFTISFSNLRSDNIEFDKSNIGYHQEAFMPLYQIKLSENSEVQDFENIDKSVIETGLFYGKLMDKEEGIKLLESGEIDAYIDEKLTLMITENGVNQIIIDEILTTFKQIETLDLPFEVFEFNRSYVNEIGDSYSYIDVIFYSLFGMISLYGAYLGTTIGNRLIVRENKVTLRNFTSSTPMSKQILISVITCTLWSIAVISIMIFYSEIILKQGFFTLDINNIPILIAATIFGISWGLFLGAFIKKEGHQIAAVIGSLLLMSTFSGLLSDVIRKQIQQLIPAIDKINPIGIIGNELMKINQLTNYTTLIQSTLTLLGYSFVLVVVSTIYIRRKTHEHI